MGQPLHTGLHGLGQIGTLESASGESGKGDTNPVHARTEDTLALQDIVFSGDKIRFAVMLELDFIKDFIESNCGYVQEKYRDKHLVTVTDKQDDPNNLLTEVDLTIQKRFVDAVQANFPGDAVMAEESGFSKTPEDTDGRVWVVDPIDGTYNFVRGLNPSFAISIAFVQGGLAQAGAVGMPLNKLLFTAEAGKGAWCGSRHLAVSKVQHMEEACFEVDFDGMDDRRALVKRALDILKKSGRIRCQGSAAVGICQVATGDVDAYLHMSLYPWDYAAAQLIAEEAGALATRLNGDPLRIFDGKKGVLVTNGAMHKTALAMLSA